MKIALVGYGRMGRAVEGVARAEGHEVVARIDEPAGVTPEALAGADVAVDFSLPDGVVRNVGRMIEAGVDAVVGTTGWYDRLPEVRAAVEAGGTGLIYAPNFSIGVHLLFRVAGHLGTLVDAVEAYDVHVEEAHHRHKVDSPSGTARALADLLVSRIERKRRWREAPPDGTPDPETLWVSSVRAGEIPGRHVVGVEGPDDRLELRHEARGRDGFARGAVAAAAWIHGQSGVHTLDDMLDERLRRSAPEEGV